MKKVLALLLTVVLALSFVAPARAESLGRLHQNEFALSYGQISFPQTLYVFGEILGIVFTLGQYQPEDTRFVGQIGAEYAHWVGRSIGLGMIVTGDYMTPKGGPSADGYTLFTLSAVPTFKASWFNYEHVGMYSKLGAGVSDYISNNTEHQFIFAFQLSPICVDFGGKHFRGFLELGYGVQGPCGGIKYVF